jgi:hypothetical protein
LIPERSTLDYIRDQLSQLLALADREGDHVLAAHISMALARVDERLTTYTR